MRTHGQHTLYLDLSDNEVSNWPGTLSFEVLEAKRGGHNWTGHRWDVWFDFEGDRWHGVTYGHQTMVCHVKRTKTPTRRAIV